MSTSTCTKIKLIALVVQTISFILTIQKPVSVNVRVSVEIAKIHMFGSPILHVHVVVVQFQRLFYAWRVTIMIEENVVASVYPNVAPGPPYLGLAVVDL